MNKYSFDESNDLWYELQGDYYISCLILSNEETQLVGLWRQRHKQYLMEHKHFVYITKQISEVKNVIEQLKAVNQIVWVTRMNNIRYRVTEIVNHDIIYN